MLPMSAAPPQQPPLNTEDAHERDALLVRDAAESCDRDGAVRARLQSDTRPEHRRDETAAGGGEGVIRALARAVAVHGARERAATWRQDDFWSRGRKLCPNRSDGGSLSSTAPVRVMQQRFYTTKTQSR